MNRNIFFSKIGLRHFSPLTSEQLRAKNLRNPMMGSMRTFVTDRRTDGPGYIGPAPLKVGRSNKDFVDTVWGFVGISTVKILV